MSTMSTMAAHMGARFPEGWQTRVPPEWLEGWSPRPFELEGGATEVVVAGEGPPLLLLPPLPGYKEAFLRLVPRLARRRRVVTFDLRATFSGPPSWDALVADLERVADASGPGAAVVRGHSLGSAVAMRWAPRRPERVTALVLSSPFARANAPSSISWKRWVEQPVVLTSLRWLPDAWSRSLARDYARCGVWVFDSGCQGPVLELVRHGIRHVPIGLARQCVGLAFAHDLRDLLAAVKTPTLLVLGELETAWAHAAEAEVARLMPHAERLTSPNAAHLHPLSAPDVLADRVLTWLDAGTPAAPPR